MKDHNCTKEKLQSLQLAHSSSSLDNIESENCCHPNYIQSKQADGTDSTKSNFENHGQIENYDDITSKVEAAEAETTHYKHENEKLILKIQDLESQIQKLNKEVSASDLLPIPPPPPPPPLPPPSFNPIKSLFTFIHAGKKSSKTVKKENSENPQQKAMSEMIDAIKKGNIQLKPTPKSVLPSPKKELEETALGEMKNILASLKKKNIPCEDAKPAEMQNIPEKSSVAFPNQETDENLNIGSDIDDELKYLLRKQSIKITTNEDEELNIDSFPCEDKKEIEKNVEFPLQETAALNEIQFASNFFSGNNQLSSENEKILDISTQELATLNESRSAHSVNSDKSGINNRDEKSLEISLQESFTSDQNHFVNNFLSKSSSINIANETSLDISLLEPAIENQFSDNNFSDNIKKITENEGSLENRLQESAAENNFGGCGFTQKSIMNTENEKSHEISLTESCTENQLIDHVFSDNDRKSNKEEKDVEIPLQEPITENHPADDVFSVKSRISTENETCLEIPFQESIASTQADHVILNNNECMENERSLEMTLQESTTQNQLVDHVFPENNKKSMKNENHLEIQLEDSATENQPTNNVSSGNKERDENEKSLEIPLQESTSEEKKFTDSFLSDNSRLSSENETVII